MRHKLLVLTVKNVLQSVYIYGSYRKIETGVPFFWTTRYIDYAWMFKPDKQAYTYYGPMSGCQKTVQLEHNFEWVSGNVVLPHFLHA